MKKQYKYKLIYKIEIEIDEADNKADLELIKRQLRFKEFERKNQTLKLEIIKNKPNV